MRKKTKNTVPHVNRRDKVNPLKINMGRGFFILNAVFWSGYGAYIYYDMSVLNNNKASADFVALFVFVNAGLLLFSGLKLGKPEKWAYYLVLGTVIFNLLLCLFNIVDLFFLLSFLFDLLTLWAVIPLRRQYFPMS